MTEDQKAEVFNSYFDYCRGGEAEMLIDIGIGLQLEERNWLGKYFICWSCASLKGWVNTSIGNTVTQGKCSWCKKDIITTLIPCCDFDGPGGKKAAWD